MQPARPVGVRSNGALKTGYGEAGTPVAPCPKAKGVEHLSVTPHQPVWWKGEERRWGIFAKRCGLYSQPLFACQTTRSRRSRVDRLAEPNRAKGPGLYNPRANGANPPLLFASLHHFRGDGDGTSRYLTLSPIRGGCIHRFDGECVFKHRLEYRCLNTPTQRT